MSPTWRSRPSSWGCWRPLQVSGSRSSVSPSPSFPHPTTVPEFSLCASRSRPGGERRLRGAGAAAGAAARPAAHPPARHQRLPHGQVRAGPLPGKVSASAPRRAAYPDGQAAFGESRAPRARWSGEVQAPRGGSVPPGSAPAPAPGTARVAREAGSGVAVVLWGAGCHLPPSPWVPVVSRGRGDPAEVIGERPAEPSWTPDAGRLRNAGAGDQVALFPGPRPQARSLCPVPLPHPCFCPVFPSPRRPE